MARRALSTLHTLQQLHFALSTKLGVEFVAALEAGGGGDAKKEKGGEEAAVEESWSLAVASPE